MSNAPLMPKATAVWLIDNTALTFQQIADYCRLHELEIKGIADGDVAQGIKGMDPIASGQLAREELDKAQADASYRMKMLKSSVQVPVSKARKGPRYTPVSRRQDRPDAIAWLLRYHPELTDGQIIKLVGTTKPTINAIRDRSHWNSSNIKPVDPVTLGLCSQLDLDFAVQKAAKRAGNRAPVDTQAPVETLIPAAQSILDEADPALLHGEPPAPAAETTFEKFTDAPEQPAAEDEALDADSVFARLKDLKLDEDASTAESENESEDETGNASATESENESASESENESEKT